MKRFARLIRLASAALLLSLAAVLLWLALVVDPILALWLLAPLLLGLAVQAAVLFLTRQGPKWLRWAPLGLTAVPLAMALNVRPRGFLWELEVILWLIIALFYLLGWALAWSLRGKGHV